MPISAAKASTARSVASVASGRPAPRKAVIEMALVATERDENPTLVQS